MEEETKRRWKSVLLFFLFTFLAFLVNTAFYLRSGPVVQDLFLGAVWVTYSFVYLLGPMLLLALWSSILTRVVPPDRPRVRALLFGVPACVLLGLVHLYFFANRRVYEFYQFHLHSGFVRNLVLTRGGIESMGSDTQTEVSVAALGVAFMLLEAVLLAAAWRLAPSRPWAHRITRRRPVLAGIACLVVLGVFERCTYAVSSLRGYTPVLASAEVFPFYLPMTVGGLARKLGFQPVRGSNLGIDVEGKRLNYPLAPLRKLEARPKYNVVWLVSESLRWDMLDQEIMPATYAFAKRAAWFRNHLSAGNGTRMGVFGMFYGLYGPYWFPFLNARRGPVLVDYLLEDNYQLELFTSARFTYPEFDKTVWARIPREKLHESELRYGWEKDRENIGKMLQFLENRDPSKPFFTFEFFESPHARYYFPPECVIREPYLETFNYATFDPSKDIELVKNRYINSCRHLDTQIERVLKFLEEKKLLDTTIVVITGDHGEEFMEHGLWGHNSKFHDEQIRAPLVLWIPGREPVEVTRMTSHLDIAPTVLKVLGLENPEADYCLGHDLFGPVVRDHAVLAGWDDLAIYDDRYTGVFPLQGLGLGDHIERTPQGYNREPDMEKFNASLQPKIKQVMVDLKRFFAKGKDPS